MAARIWRSCFNLWPFLESYHSPTQKEQDSPFLRLPGEIRNIIYSYTLSYSEVICRCELLDNGERRYRLYSKLEPYECPEINQLKYTCRQLHYETSGLGLQYNTLKFLRPIKTGEEFSSVAGAHFLRTCSEAKRNLVKAHLWDTFGDQGPETFSIGTMIKLVSYCQENQKLEITVHLDVRTTWMVHVWTGLYLMCLIQSLIRKSLPNITLPLVIDGRSAFGYIRDTAGLYVTIWEGFAPDAPPLPANYVIRFGNDKVILEKFMKDLRELSDMDCGNSVYSQWIQQCEIWMRDGL